MLAGNKAFEGKGLTVVDGSGDGVAGDSGWRILTRSMAFSAMAECFVSTFMATRMCRTLDDSRAW